MNKFTTANAHAVLARLYALKTFTIRSVASTKDLNSLSSDQLTLAMDRLRRGKAKEVQQKQIIAKENQQTRIHLFSWRLFYFVDFLQILKSHFCNFMDVVQGPRLSGRLREVSAMNLVYVSSKSEVVGPSYDHFCILTICISHNLVNLKPWRLSYAILDLKFGFYTSQTSPGTPPYGWKHEVRVKQRKPKESNWKHSFWSPRPQNWTRPCATLSYGSPGAVPGAQDPVQEPDNWFVELLRLMQKAQIHTSHCVPLFDLTLTFPGIWRCP